jgi:hypothetical protein
MPQFISRIYPETIRRVLAIMSSTRWELTLYITTEYHGRIQDGKSSSFKYLVYDHLCASSHPLI